MNIILIGPMGAGKSTIGRILSQELRLSFIDVDREIEERAGANIPWIFDVEGEGGFRDREQQVLFDLSQKQDQVIATGGGAVLRAENRSCIQSQGFVVYLKTSIDQQLERTEKDKNRPLLQTEDPRKVLEDLIQQREPLYLQSADLTIETDKRHPRNVAIDIIKQLSQRGIVNE